MDFFDLPLDIYAQTDYIYSRKRVILGTRITSGSLLSLLYIVLPRDFKPAFFMFKFRHSRCHNNKIQISGVR